MKRRKLSLRKSCLLKKHGQKESSYLNIYLWNMDMIYALKKKKSNYVSRTNRQHSLRQKEGPKQGKKKKKKDKKVNSYLHNKLVLNA